MKKVWYKFPGCNRPSSRLILLDVILLNIRSRHQELDTIHRLDTVWAIEFISAYACHERSVSPRDKALTTTWRASRLSWSVTYDVKRGNTVCLGDRTVVQNTSGSNIFGPIGLVPAGTSPLTLTARLTLVVGMFEIRCGPLSTQSSYALR